MKEWSRRFLCSRFALCFLTAVILIAANAGAAYCIKKNRKQPPVVSFRLSEKAGIEISMELMFEPPAVEQIREALKEALGYEIQNANLVKTDLSARYRSGDHEGEQDEDASEGDLDVEDRNAASQSSHSESETNKDRPEFSLWTFTATSADAFPKHDFHIEGQLKLEPIVNLFKSSGVSSVTVALMHPVYGQSQCTRGNEAVYTETEYGYHFFRIPIEGAAFQTVKLSYGYKTADLILPIALPLSFLLLPIALSLFLRRAVLKSEGEKRTAAWLRLWKSTSWIAIVAWVGWSLIFSFPLMKDMLRLVSLSGATALHTGFNIGIFLIPPTFVIGICTGLMLSVNLRMRGISYTRRDVVLQVLIEQVGGIIILVLFSMGLGTVFFAPRQGILLLAGAFAASAIITSLKKRFLNLSPYALEIGELRDRIFEMARRCGVKLKQVYILPEDKMKTINAMASSKDQIFLTNGLLANLNKSEIEAVVAHELGHLKHRHPKSIGRIFIVGIILMNVGASTLAWTFGFNYGFTVCVLIFLFAMSHFSRKFEYAADIHSAYLMGDPRPLISALAKMSRLTMLPMSSDRLSEMVSTHPYTQKRAEALSRFANLPEEELQGLVTESEAVQEQYELASITENSDRVFSTSAKEKHAKRLLVMLIGAMTLTPALFAFVAFRLGMTDSARLLIYCGGFIATTAIYLWLTNIVPVTGYRAMIVRLREKLGREKIGPLHQQGAFVGFSPDSEIRLYENNYDWDLGYLFLASDRLCYVGEQTRFAVLADQIREITIASSSSAWWKSERVFISWLDPERNVIKTFNLHACDATSLTDSSRKTRALALRLQEWRSGSSQGTPIASSILDLRQPEIGEVTSRSLSEANAPRNNVNLIFVLLFMTTTLALVLQLPFNPQRGGAALYAIAVTLFVTLLAVIPSLKVHRNHRAPAVQPQVLASVEAVK